MKRTLLAPMISASLAAAVWLASGVTLRAQNDAAITALRQEYDEHLKKLDKQVEDLLAFHASLQRRINNLADTIQTLREEQSRSANNAVRPADFRQLSDKLRELDQKREDDRKLILEELHKLAQTPLPEPPPKREKPKDKEPEPATDGAAGNTPMHGYDYVVKQDDTLGAIVAAYQKAGTKVTLDQVLKANPHLKPKSLRVGQKIFIPDPAAQ